MVAGWRGVWLIAAVISLRRCLTVGLCSTILCFIACSRSDRVSVDATRPAPLRIGFIGVSEAQPTGAEGFAVENGQLIPALERLGFQKPTFVRFANGPDLNEAFSGGSLDVGIYGDTPALVGRAAGLPTRLINQSVVGMDAWLLVPRAGVATLDELAGKVVATSKGSYMHRYLAGLLSEKGLGSRVTLVHLLPADAQAALERGEIAAYAAPSQTAPLLVSKGARVLDRASQHPGLQGSSVTVVSEAFLARHPSFPAQWNELRAQAVAQLLREPERYYQFHAERVRLPVTVIKQGFPLELFHVEPLVPGGRKLLEGTKSFLVDQKLAQNDFELSAWLTR
ncbi:MAG TPA: ABC transporter substrate-binding protein [Polyangiaceae bacterium]|nr:ABC transporter substrate-binding protein [Polyangiaceae bacterium]